MTTFGRLQANWVYGGFLAGLALIALAPLATAGWDRAATLAYLTLPTYMIHQLEEHDDDRFRRFVNAVVGQGREALSVAAVFWINILGVWALLVAVLWLVRGAGSGWAAAAGWLLLVNGVLHLVQGIALRRYNPGLATGVVLFLPLGWLTLAAAWPVASATQIGLGLVVALAVHGAILAHVRSSLKRAPAGAVDPSKGG